MDAANFREVMGFSAGQEVMYEDDEADTSIPDIQKITKKNNVLPIHGSPTTMNLNHLVLENIIQSTYYKNFLCEITTFQQVVEEVYYNVTHLEPWERGTRKLHGMSGMCGGVRGVGAGGVISTAFCLLYKLFTLRVTRKQLVSMINSTQSVYLRGIGFIYIRFTQPPADLWAWFSPYLTDEEEVDPRSGGGDTMLLGELLKNMLTKLDWYGTLFPRIPIPIQKDIDQKLEELRKPQGYDASKSWKGDRDSRRREDERHDRRHESSSRSQESSSKSHGPKRKRCGHHLRHHHCHKHRKICPKKAKKLAEKSKELNDEKVDISNE